MVNDERNDNLKTSMQATGLDLAYYWNIFEDPYELFLCDEFSCIQTKVDGINAIVVIKTAMVPEDPFFDENAQEMMPEYAKYVSEKWLKDRDDFDIYYLGIVLKQTRVSKSEEGEYRLGGKYSGSTSPARLIKNSKSRDYGYDISNPFRLSMISDEYYLVEHLVYDGKAVDQYYRTGSMHAPNGHIVDEWIIRVTIGNQRYEYPIYLDPYVLKPFENAFEEDVSIFGFALNK